MMEQVLGSWRLGLERGGSRTAATDQVVDVTVGICF
jgi:hypothetical protein